MRCFFYEIFKNNSSFFDPVRRSASTNWIPFANPSDNVVFWVDDPKAWRYPNTNEHLVSYRTHTHINNVHACNLNVIIHYNVQTWINWAVVFSKHNRRFSFETRRQQRHESARYVKLVWVCVFISKHIRPRVRVNRFVTGLK